MVKKRPWWLLEAPQRIWEVPFPYIGHDPFFGLKPSLKLAVRTCEWMVGILVWDGLFSGAMLVSGRVHGGYIRSPLKLILQDHLPPFPDNIHRISIGYIPTSTIKNQPNVGKYDSPMDPMGYHKVPRVGLQLFVPGFFYLRLFQVNIVDPEIAPSIDTFSKSPRACTIRDGRCEIGYH